MVDLHTPLTRLLPGRTPSYLRTARGLETAGDLLWFLPRAHLDAHGDLGDLTEGAYVVFVGTVVRAATRRMRNRPGTMLNAVVEDGRQELDLTFFKAQGHAAKLTPGRRGLFAGRATRYGGRWQLAHPAYEMFSEPGEGTSEAGPDPVMPLIPRYLEVPKVTNWTLMRCVETVLDALDGDGEADALDPLPADLRRRRSLPGLLAAFRMVHLPATREDYHRGMHRLGYDEALTIQLALAQRRGAQDEAAAIPRLARPGGLLETFDERLPFDLTPGQRTVGTEIAADLARPHPMQRLLQGEVGSGKTLVALRAMLAVVDAGGQAALLAPTEVLAAQHHRSITGLLGDLAQGGPLGGAEHGTRVALLTGSQSAAARRAALLDAASGAAGIVIGTHALIQRDVQFADLGLVVVDEQHRFGVEQRDALRSKAARSPHMLVMTATPIPRTVAMTVFGDLDVSTLAELPGGRRPISSYVVDNERWYARAWERVAEELAKGHQAYVVCARIGDGDEQDEEDEETAAGPPAGSATEPDEGSWPDDEQPEAEVGPPRGVIEVLEELRARPALAGARIEALHGRMPTEEKDAVMAAFSAGEIGVLVATTVIEVGVDVPNATVMVVMDADRFGVSQLHQLRGRVGRGSAPGLCLLVRRGDSPAAVERVAAVAATTDGFELSRLDLAQRREGDILGASQSGGRSQLRVLRLSRDEELISQARTDAAALLAEDPTLVRHPELRAQVLTWVDDEQAAFLERG